LLVDVDVTKGKVKPGNRIGEVLGQRAVLCFLSPQGGLRLPAFPELEPDRFVDVGVVKGCRRQLSEGRQQRNLSSRYSTAGRVEDED
jgi:hypothetical protein